MALWEITIRGLVFGQTHQNVLHATSLEGPSKSLEDVALDIRDSWLGAIKTLSTNQLVYNSIQVRDLQNPTLAPAIIAFNIPGTQGADNDMLTFACMVLIKETARAGRKGRGRYYISALGTAAFSQGLLTQARLDGWEALRPALQTRYLSDSAASGIRFVLRHKDGEGFEPLTALRARQIVGIQRRRNIGTGI